MNGGGSGTGGSEGWEHKKEGKQELVHKMKKKYIKKKRNSFYITLQKEEQVNKMGVSMQENTVAHQHRKALKHAPAVRAPGSLDCSE